MEQNTLVSAADWLKYTANLGTYIFLIGALLQYLVLRIKATTSIPQTLTILTISRAISIIIAWIIWFLYPKGVSYMFNQFVFIPAVASEMLLLLITFLIIQFYYKKNG